MHTLSTLPYKIRATHPAGVMPERPILEGPIVPSLQLEAEGKALLTTLEAAVAKVAAAKAPTRAGTR